MAQLIPMLTRQLPHNIDAEMAVLGGMLMDNGIAQAVPWLKAEHFVLADHRVVFQAIMTTVASGRRADLVTMKAVFASDDTLNQVGGVDYLLRLINCSATPINSVEYARLIVDLYVRRELIAAGEDITDRNYKVNGVTTSSNIATISTTIDRLRSIIPDDTEEIMEVASVPKEDVVPVHEFVPGLIAPGLTLLCAKPKVGKSWMLLDMGMSLAEGGVTLGQLRCPKTESLLILLEDSKRRVSNRANRLRPEGKAMGCRFAVAWPRGKEGLNKLERELDKRPGTKVVGIDVLAAFRGPLASDGGGYQSDYDAVKEIQEVAQRRGIAIIVLHHLRKAEGDDPVDLISGTLGIAGAADHLIVITGNIETGHKLTMRGRDLPDVQWDMTFCGGVWTVVGDSAPRHKVMDAVEKIDRNNKIRECAEKGMSCRDIASSMGISKSLVAKVLSNSTESSQLCV